MTLIVEDGTIVAGANSYVTDNEYVAYASARGITVGVDAPTREQELLKAMDYLESFRDDFKGFKITGTQPLQWPRYSVWVDGYQLDSNAIPNELKYSQIELAVLSRTTSLTPSGSFQDVASQKLDVLEVSYHKGGSWTTVQMKSVEQYLKALLIQGRGKRLRTIRI